MRLRRPLLAREMARLHGWPIEDSELAKCGSVVPGGIRSLLFSNKLTCVQLCSMIGDSWHLRVQGCFWMFLLANLTKVTMPLRVMKRANTESTDDAITPSKKRNWTVSV